MNRDLNAIDWSRVGEEKGPKIENQPTLLCSSPSVGRSSSQTLKSKELFSNIITSSTFPLGIQ